MVYQQKKRNNTIYSVLQPKSILYLVVDFCCKMLYIYSIEIETTTQTKGNKMTLNELKTKYVEQIQERIARYENKEPLNDVTKMKLRQDQIDLYRKMIEISKNYDGVVNNSDIAAMAIIDSYVVGILNK